MAPRNDQALAYFICGCLRNFYNRRASVILLNSELGVIASASEAISCSQEKKARNCAFGASKNNCSTWNIIVYNQFMYLDIAVCLLMLVSMFLGWRRGFLRGCLGFISSLVGFVAVIFIAGPMAGSLGTWINAAPWLLTIISCVIIFAVVWIVFFILGRFVKRIKRDSKALDKADKIGGIFLGAAKFFVSLCMTFVSLHLLTGIPFMVDVCDWLFSGSVICRPIYDLTVDIIVPLFGPLFGQILP